MVKNEKFCQFLNQIRQNQSDSSQQKEEKRERKRNQGISQQAYDTYHREICRKKGMKDNEIEPAKDVMKLSDQEIDDFYHHNYVKYKVDKIEDINTGQLYFDTVMELGPGRTTKLLQQVCNTKVDGVFGKNSLSALNSMNQNEFQTRFCEERKKHYRNTIITDKERLTDNFISDRILNGIAGVTQNQKDQQQTQTTTKEEANNTQDNQQLGGIDCKVDISLLNRIQGINQLSARFLIGNQTNIILSDLATVLQVLLDKNLQEKHKRIQFSLDPIIIPDQEIYQEQEKVCYPDKIVKKSIIQNTDFARVLFESDFLLKLMTLGVEADGKTPFNYPEELKELQLLIIKRKNEDQGGSYRFWLTPQQCFYHQKNNKYIIEDMKVICQTRQMERINDKLVDKEIQDINNSNYQFASKFTQLYDKIAKYYPIFNRLKQLFKAVALGRWMYENRINIHYQELSQFCKMTNNEPYIIPIVHSIQLGELKSVYQIMKNILDDQENNLVSEVLDEVAESIPLFKNLEIPASVEQSFGGVDTLCQNMIVSNINPKIDKFQDLKEIDIPFFTQKKCTECNRMIESNLLNLEQNQCSIHSDCTCYLCLELITYEESNPRYCYINKQNHILHQNCFDEYQRIINGEEDQAY
ncbi:unnamed protein product [Paramecium sonneborni]|uniref:Uncharacterized protein n=1 Tax=Paramecium sonneborni TaxID=65129 RepID=A0A8S1RI08_9CILI|nr:unnamed protein product [Paramecium sonneborni]